MCNVYKLFVLSLLTVLTGIIIAPYVRALCTNNRNEPGTVIILNGPSASGKSSIQKAFQDLMMPQLWAKMGIDNLFDKLFVDITLDNMAFWQSPNDMRWVESTTDDEGNPVITLYVGPGGKKIRDGMHAAIAAYARAGNNIIVDYINYDESWLSSLLSELSGLPVVLVKVAIPLEVLEARERARGTSPVGHARSHYDHVYGQEAYDLEIDSGTMSPQKCAQAITDYIITR